MRHRHYQCQNCRYGTADPSSIRRHQENKHPETFPNECWTKHECSERWEDNVLRIPKIEKAHEEDSTLLITAGNVDLMSHNNVLSQVRELSRFANTRRDSVGQLVQSSLHAPNLSTPDDPTPIRLLYDLGIIGEDEITSIGPLPVPIGPDLTDQGESGTFISTSSSQSHKTPSLEGSWCDVGVDGNGQFRAAMGGSLPPACAMSSPPTGYGHPNSTGEVLTPNVSDAAGRSPTIDGSSTMVGADLNQSPATRSYDSVGPDYVAALARSGNNFLKTFRGFS